MSFALVAAGVAVAAGGVGAVEANQNRQKQKGTQGTAYGIASKQLGLAQLGTRESTAENLVARGLTGGGDVTAGTPASATTPSPAGARSLGGQVGSDLAVQQSLEVQNLKNANTAQLQQINAAADAAEVGSVAAGVGGAARALGSPTGPVTPPAGPSASATPTSLGLPSSPAPGPYPASYGGIDPINPLGRGAWSGPNTSAGFNVNTPF